MEFHLGIPSFPMDLLQRLLEMKNAIVLYATDYNLQVLTANEWKLMENVIRLLQPFEEYTKLLSSNNAPISVVIPAVAVLQHYLNKDDGEKSAGVRTMKQEFHNAVKSRFENVITNQNYVVATTVDPRFKTAFTTEKGRELLLQEVRKFSRPVEEITEDEEERTHSTKKSASAKNRVDLWDCFDELVASSTTPATQMSSGNPEEKEVSDFLAMPLVNKEVCQFKWWVEQKSAFPNDYQVAKRFLSAPCSSVYSERIFSEAGNILNEKRSRLNPSKSESLLFLHHNLPKLHFDY